MISSVLHNFCVTSLHKVAGPPQNPMTVAFFCVHKHHCVKILTELLRVCKSTQILSPQQGAALYEVWVGLI